MNDSKFFLRSKTLWANVALLVIGFLMFGPQGHTSLMAWLQSLQGDAEKIIAGITPIANTLLRLFKTNASLGGAGGKAVLSSWTVLLNIGVFGVICYLILNAQVDQRVALMALGFAFVNVLLRADSHQRIKLLPF